LVFGLIFPDRRNIYESLQEFLDEIAASVGSPTRPKVYSRQVLVIRARETPLPCTA